MPYTALEVLVVGVTYLAASHLLAWAGRLLRHRDAASGRAARPSSRWWQALLSGLLLAAAARWLAGSVTLGWVDLALILWAVLFVLGFLLSAIEATVFSAGRGPIRRSDVLGAFLLHGLTAMAAGFVMAPNAGMAPNVGMAPNAEVGLLQQLHQHVGVLGWQPFLLHVAGAAVAYMVAYCVLGTIAWRFIGPYYQDPAHGLDLRVPSAAVILPLQIGRGLVATVVLLPFVLLPAEQDLGWWCGLSASLALVTAVVPVLNAPEWPGYLRLVHGVEITLFSFVQAASLWWLL